MFAVGVLLGVTSNESRSSLAIATSTLALHVFANFRDRAEEGRVGGVLPQGELIAIHPGAVVGGRLDLDDHALDRRRLAQLTPVDFNGLQILEPADVGIVCGSRIRRAFGSHGDEEAVVRIRLEHDAGIAPVGNGGRAR